MKKCLEFRKRGRCSRGDACPFAHVAKEKAPAPVAAGPKRCFTWAKKGKCRKGDRCKYAHTYRGDGVYSAALQAIPLAAAIASRHAGQPHAGPCVPGGPVSGFVW